MRRRASRRASSSARSLTLLVFCRKGSPPSAGNLTDMLLEGDDGISMMQFGEGQGVVLPSGELLVCGWFKLNGRPPGELDKTDSIACLSSTVRTRLFCWTQGSPWI